ncbi:ATP-binding cassette domain-containing protein [Polymorphospora rubra]|uniref:ATP-binding cassette domain-containing protein n=1 Tax=Polymorphospora rubra TaxID=338584 RepID=UPI003408C884
MIRARGLTRDFARGGKRGGDAFRAVDGVDLDVGREEIVGFLGPNGAGKSTTLRMLTTLLRPTAGTATVAGHDVVAEPRAVRGRIGYVSQAGAAAGGARAGDEVVDRGMLYGLHRRQARARGAELFEWLELDGLWDRPVRTLSGGQRRRLDVVMGLIHRPRIVFLDEPSTGLDPHSRANLWQHIRDMRTGHEVTVFLTTHYLDEADALCDRIIVIDHGSIVASDTPGGLKRQLAGDAITLELLGEQDLPVVLPVLESFTDQGVKVTVEGRELRARIRDAGTTAPALLRALDQHGIVLAGIEVRRPTLDDVFLTLTGRSLREQR